MPTQRDIERNEERMANASTWGQERKFEPTSIKVPDGMEWYKLEVGRHEVDFLPYRVGDNNPKADAGFIDYKRTWDAHELPNADGRKRRYVCGKCVKQDCAICQWRRIAGMDEPELVKDSKIKTRHLFIINDKPGDTKNTLKLFDANDWNRGKGFGELMREAIEENPEKYGQFFHLKKGCKVVLTVKELPPFSSDGKPYNAVTRISFAERDYTYDKGFIDQMPCLDDCFVVLSKKQVAELVPWPGEGGDDEPAPVKAKAKAKPVNDDEDDEPKATKPKPKAVPKDDDEDDEPAAPAGKVVVGSEVTFEYKGKTRRGVVKSIGKVNHLASILCADRDEPYNVHVDELELAKGKPAVKVADPDEEDDAPKPVAGKVKPKAKPVDDEDEDEDEEEDDEDEVPKKPKGKGKPAADDEEEEEDDTPKKGKGKPKDDEEEEEDEEDDDDWGEEEDKEDEDEAPRKPRRR